MYRNIWNNHETFVCNNNLANCGKSKLKIKLFINYYICCSIRHYQELVY